ncbi:hypothetical protein M407DRAFT_23244 [Tulasnella calospora MUT 4182]|uniref:Uncharacterized protein n=1 Tax=Tulasnella calospora MUT 4182 TaxID=1051891 RepID=A0A0C3L1F9_9AGAM|nr:hypothetical protein M407DRAFT_23244 [Tulasnella calospora MUT 4182]
MIRPDLALLVQHLEICDSYCDRWSMPSDEIAKVLGPDGTNALRLAKNIRSLALLGPNDWIYRPERTGLRDAVSKMKLTHLKIEDTFGGTIWQGYSRSGYRDWEGDLGKEIRTILQAQPLLESLSFVKGSFYRKTVEQLQTHLQPSDAPRLKYLTGNPEFATACIGSISGLECWI